MITCYFDIIENLMSVRVPKLKFFLALIYFPFLIICYFISFNYTECSWSFIHYMIIITLSTFAPAIIIPALFFLQNKNFFLIRKFTKIIDSLKINLNDNFEICNEKNIIFSNTLNNVDNIFIIYNYNIILKKNANKDRNHINDEVIYNPNKRITKLFKEKVKLFYDKDAKNYFDILQYDFQFFFGLISTKKIITKESSFIVIYEELRNSEIANLISVLNKITSIDKKQIALLFKKSNRETKLVERLNWNSIKSSESQRLKIFKN